MGLPRSELGQTCCCLVGQHVGKQSVAHCRATRFGTRNGPGGSVEKAVLMFVLAGLFGPLINIGGFLGIQELGSKGVQTIALHILGSYVLGVKELRQ